MTLSSLAIFASTLALARGLCNAVMAAAPSSTFGAHWYEQYRHFRASGHDDFWDEHSVGLPGRLWERCGSLRGRLAGRPPTARALSARRPRGGQCAPSSGEAGSAA